MGMEFRIGTPAIIGFLFLPAFLRAEDVPPELRRPKPTVCTPMLGDLAAKAKPAIGAPGEIGPLSIKVLPSQNGHTLKLVTCEYNVTFDPEGYLDFWVASYLLRDGIHQMVGLPLPEAAGHVDEENFDSAEAFVAKDSTTWIVYTGHRNGVGRTHRIFSVRNGELEPVTVLNESLEKRGQTRFYHKFELRPDSEAGLRVVESERRWERFLPRLKDGKYLRGFDIRAETYWPLDWQGLQLVRSSSTFREYSNENKGPVTGVLNGGLYDSPGDSAPGGTLKDAQFEVVFGTSVAGRGQMLKLRLTESGRIGFAELDSLQLVYPPDEPVD
jgi:hypothetical protein